MPKTMKVVGRENKKSQAMRTTGKVRFVINDDKKGIVGEIWVPNELAGEIDSVSVVLD